MPPTILIADDSPTIQRRASGILTGEGLDVVTVSNGVAAIKKLPTVRPLVVLADVSMPGKDGYEVCQFIKQSPDLAHVPVLLIFSDLEPYEEGRGAQVGANGRIKKPFVHDELVDTVKRFIAQAEAALPPPPPATAPFTDPSDTAEPIAEAHPEVTESQPEPEISTLAEGIAFSSPFHEDVSSAPDEPAASEPELPPLAAVEQESAIAAEPELVEESFAPIEESHSHPHPHEHAAIFHAPEEIPEPVLAGELEPESPLAVEYVSDVRDGEGTEAALLESEPPPMAAGESPQDTAAIEQPAGEATASPEERSEPPAVAHAPESEPAAEISEATPEPASPVPPAQALGADQVYAIVHQVVLKMSPPALPAQTVEDLARRLTDEIISETNNH